MSRRFSLLAFALALVLAPIHVARAQATLVTGLGGPRGYGTSCLSGSDDGSSPAVPLATAFPMGLNFFGTTQSTAYVNVNGNITFNGPQACYTPNAFPIAMQPMIAPFWGDVDLRTFTRTGVLGNRVCMGPEGMPPNAAGMCPVQTITSCSMPASNGIWYHLESGRMVVTWDQVGYYQCQDAPATRNSFQLILTAVSGGCGSGTMGTDFDVEFRYNVCNWEAGQASGDTNGNGQCNNSETTCVPAQAGFDAGNLHDFTEIMGSRTHGIPGLLCTGSNTMPAQPGVWQFQVRGGVVMTCPNAGMPCSVSGQMGVCAAGRLNCASGSSTASCVQQVQPNAERCDNQDNDCDGMVDETDQGNLCGTREVCQAGTCVDGCFEGACPGGLTCDNGHCVDAACIGMTCSAGQRCVAGSCVDPCAGVTCPHGEMCANGRCVDPCSGITCDACTACVAGSCVARCTASSCAAGQTCDMNGVCVESACANMTCGAGTYCMGGACVDACTGVTCPTGEACMGGECIQQDLPDAAVIPMDANIPHNDAAILPMDDAGPMPMMDANVRGDAGHHPVHSSGGCGCRAGESGSPAGLAWLAAIGMLITLHRRRR